MNERELTSSISVNTTAKGDYTFSVKIYFDAGVGDDGVDPIEVCKFVNEVIEDTYKDLHKKFPNK